MLKKKSISIALHGFLFIRMCWNCRFDRLWRRLKRFEIRWSGGFNPLGGSGPARLAGR